MRLTGELHTVHELLTNSSNPLRKKRTEVTQVRQHDASCGFPFFIPRPTSLGRQCTKSPLPTLDKTPPPPPFNPTTTYTKHPPTHNNTPKTRNNAPPNHRPDPPPNHPPNPNHNNSPLNPTSLQLVLFPPIPCQRQQHRLYHRARETLSRRRQLDDPDRRSRQQPWSRPLRPVLVQRNGETDLGHEHRCRRALLDREQCRRGPF